jgi:hypothetical protein
MKKVFVDRSRVESFQRCPRLRFHSYHDGPQHLGLESAKKALPLAVGGSVHKGLEHLLRQGQALLQDCDSSYFDKVNDGLRGVEDEAVAIALADFATHSVELDTTELAAMTPQPDIMTQQLAGSLGMTPEEAGLGAMAERLQHQQGAFDSYLAKEQAALVEALIRAYARRRLRPLLEQFEVLEVEREGEWLLSEWNERDEEGSNLHIGAPYDNALWFMSRPDALLLERESQQLYILSFKTAASWDIRKAKDAERDMQGLSEGVEVEQRLAEWWQALQNAKHLAGVMNKDITIVPTQIHPDSAMGKFLLSQFAPPRILGIRYEYILKGERWTDKDLSAKFNMTCRSQRSHLIRAYMNPGMAAGDEQFNWAWDYLKPDGSGESSKLYWKSWRSAPVWEHMSIKRWIDMLDSAAMAVSGDDAAEGLAPRELGYKSQAQATGYTAEHPLDSVFISPIVVYRSEDSLRDWVEQVESQERRVAESVAQVESATDEGERRHLLNVLFTQTRRACEYPTTCSMSTLCWGTEAERADPIGSGRYVTRHVNHPQEQQAKAERA